MDHHSITVLPCKNAIAEYQNCMKQLRRQSSLMSTPSATSTVSCRIPVYNVTNSLCTLLQKSQFEDSDMDASEYYETFTLVHVTNFCMHTARPVCCRS